MPHSALVPLALFLALLAAATLLVLAASGHFPLAQRAAALRSRAGTALLCGALVLAALALALGAAVAWRRVPWTALVIGGGAVVLAAPLALRALPDRFVDGRAALLVFAGAAALLALALMLGAE